MKVIICFVSQASVDLGNNFSSFYKSVFQRWDFFTILSLCQPSNPSFWFLEKKKGNIFGLYSMLKLSSFISENVSLLPGLNLE